MNRRSFLAAVMGSIGASAVPAFARPVARDVWRDFSIWETVIVQPGQICDEAIFPAPLPNDFWVDRIDIRFADETLVNSLYALLNQVAFGATLNGRPYAQMPLWFFAASPLAHFTAVPKLAIPLKITSGDELGMRLSSIDAVGVIDPVPVTVLLSGRVKL